MLRGQRVASKKAQNKKQQVKKAKKKVHRIAQNSHTTEATKKKAKKVNRSQINFSDLRNTTLPTPYPIQIAEKLQEEDEKRVQDSKSPLRGMNATTMHIDIPLMSRLAHVTPEYIADTNAALEKQGVDPKHFLKTPKEAIPNFDKMTDGEKLLLNAGYITLVPGSSQYVYMPMAMRVLDKLNALINEELLQFGAQKVELPSVVEKKLLDEFLIHRAKMVAQNEALKTSRQKELEALVKNKNNNNDDDIVLTSSIYDDPQSPYYRFYNLQDEELIVSPPLIDYFSAIIKQRVKLASQLPQAYYQFSKKLRDLNDENAALNNSTNIDETNENIAQMRHLKTKGLLEEEGQQQDDSQQGNNNNNENQQDGLQHHPSFTNQKNRKNETLMNGLITSNEYQSLNSVTFHGDGDDAHQMYKATLYMFNRIFQKLGVHAVQVEADGSGLGAELSHEYHIVLGTPGNPKERKKLAQQPPVTHALVQCGLCGYAANTQNAQFAIPDGFDHASYNSRMKTGKLTKAMRHDPRSFGIFEASGGDPNFDRDIRAKVTALTKQMMPNLARRDVPMVANVVKLHYTAGQDKFYDETGDVKVDHKPFVNHAVIMIRADREFNMRAIARHFGCARAEVLTAAESALLLLKFQKFKQRQYQEMINNSKGGTIDPKLLDPSFNIFGDMHTRTLPMSTRDLEKMYSDMNDVTALEKEQRRLRRVAARRDVNAGLVIVCDNTLVAQGIDLDDEAMLDKKFLEKDNTDRSFGLKMNDSTSQTKSLVDRLGGYRNAREFEASEHVPPQYAEQFGVLFKAIKDGMLSVDKDTGDLILNDVTEDLLQKFDEFAPVNPDESPEEAKQRLLQKLQQDVIDVESWKEGEESPEEKLKRKRAEVKDVFDEDELSEDRNQSDNDIDILALEAEGKSVREIFESAINEDMKAKRKKYWDQNKDTDEIVYFENEHGDIVDADGQVLPHITTDTRADRETRRAYGKSGYDQIGDDDPDQGGILEERLLSTVNPSQGDFVAPQPGDKCVQTACHSQGMLEGLRSIEVGKVFYLSDSLTRNTDAVVMNNVPNRRGVIDNKLVPIHMTAFKIGVSRLMSAIVESCGHDKYGLSWPETIAPYQITLIADPTIPVNFKRYKTTVLDERGESRYDMLDIHEAYIHHARIAAEDYERDIEKQRNRLAEIARTPGLSPGLDKERNKIAAAAYAALSPGEDEEDGYNPFSKNLARMKFGYWSWGLADNHAHAVNMAVTLARTVPHFEDELIYDDRHTLSVEQRLHDAFALGIPWAIVIDDLMQEKGQVRVINRAKQQMELLSVDQVVHLFAGQRPLHQRPEHQNTEFERSMKYKVENAIMAHFGKKAMHEGDAEFFRIENKQRQAFDYNTHVDTIEAHDAQEDESPLFDADRNLVTSGSKEAEDARDEYMKGLRAREQALAGENIDDSNFVNDAPPNGPAKDGQFLEDTMAETMKELQSGKKPGDEDNAENKPAAQEDAKPEGKAIDQWYRIIKKMRRRLPPPTASELDRMFRTGILYKDSNGEVQVNHRRANDHMHVIYGVDPHVVDQYERGNVMSLGSTEQGASEIIDKHEYLQKQRVFTAQRIEKQLEAGYFDLTLDTEKLKQLEHLKEEQTKLQTKIKPNEPTADILLDDTTAQNNENTATSRFMVEQSAMKSQEQLNKVKQQQEEYMAWKKAKDEQEAIKLEERREAGRLWQEKRQVDAYEVGMKSLFGGVKMVSPSDEINAMNEQRRRELAEGGVKFRSLKDGHAIVKKPGARDEETPFDVRYDILDKSKKSEGFTPDAPQYTAPRGTGFSYKKKSLSEAFSSAPTLRPNLPEADELFGKKSGL